MALLFALLRARHFNDIGVRYLWPTDMHLTIPTIKIGPHRTNDLLSLARWSGAMLSTDRRYVTRDRRIWYSQLVGYRTASLSRRLHRHEPDQTVSVPKDIERQVSCVADGVACKPQRDKKDSYWIAALKMSSADHFLTPHTSLFALIQFAIPLHIRYRNKLDSLH